MKLKTAASPIASVADTGQASEDAPRGPTSGGIAFRAVDPAHGPPVSAHGPDASGLLHEARAALRESEARFHVLTMLSTDWYWEQDRNFRYTAIGGDRFLGAAFDDNIIGMTPWEMPFENMSEGDWQAHRAQLAAAMPFLELELRRRDSTGQVRTLLVSGLPILDARGECVGYRGITRDMTERKNAQARIERINSLYEALTETNEAVGRITERAALFQEVSRIAVRHGRFVMAAIWMREPGSALVRTMACAGEARAYLDHLPLTIDLDTAEAKGPTGIALLDGHPDICNDLSEPRIAPWQSRDASAGFRSCAAFPLRADGTVVGTLTLYAALAGCFDDKLVDLLSTMAANLSRALDKIKRDSEHAAAEAALRKSETRFRSLTELSSDWYWEQDENLRFIAHSGGAMPGYGMHFGLDEAKTRWELPHVGVSDAQWQAHRDDLAARRPFRDFEFQRKASDGRTLHVSVSGEPMFDETGRFTGYRGVGRDITERRRAEQMQELEHAVARSLAAANDSATALKATIRLVCESEGWACGRYWQLDDAAGVLRGDESWSGENAEIDAFYAKSRGKVFDPKVGLVGLVLESRQPLWISDIGADSRARHFAAAYQIGLRSIWLSPVVAEAKIIGVLGFMSRDFHEPDQRLLNALRAIGSQAGQFLQRKRREEELRESEMRYRLLTDLSSDWYWEHDEQGRFTRSDNLVDRAGIRVAGMLGKTRWETGIRYDAGDRERLEADIAARRPFRDFEYCRIDHDHVEHYVQTSGTPMYDAAGRYIGYRGIAKDVSERRRRDLDLQRFRVAMDATADAIYLTDREGTRFIDVNDGACRMLGYARAELLAMEPRDVFSTSQSDRQRVDQAMLDGATDVQEIEALHQRKDGSYIPVEVHRRAQRSGDDWIIVGVARDISARIQAEHAISTNSMQQGLIAKFGQHALAMADLDELLERAVAVVVKGLGLEFCNVLEFGADGRTGVLRAGAGWNEGWTGRRFAAAEEEGTQTRFAPATREPVIVDELSADSRFQPLEILGAHGIRSGLEVIIGGAGAAFGMLGVYSRARAAFPQESVDFVQSVANLLGTAVERRNSEVKLAYLAQFDSLTGLPNRDLFRDRLAQTLEQAKRHNWTVGVLYMDLDGFKRVNDTFGHAAGDKLLALVAQRLRACVRSSDTVGRLGGDEFAIVLANLAESHDAELVAQQVVAALVRPFDIEDHDMRMTASVGISLYPADGKDAGLLLKNADTAMYRAKERGRNNFQFYTAGLNDRMTRRWELEQELRRAIDLGEFELFYQPQVSIATRRVIGAEALIRWHHPVRGLLEPVEFIGTAEESGLILPIGRWVIETACAQAALWHGAGYSDMFVAVNISPVEIEGGNVPEQVEKALKRSGLAPNRLEIELTESAVLDGAQSIGDLLSRLKQLGVSIAVDDFGPGYSSLSYLRRWPIDKVKIDQTFVRDIVTNHGDSAIVQAVIAMSHHLKLSVVAEGVETEPQAAFLLHCQCDAAQGVLFGAPMPAAALSELLKGPGNQPGQPDSSRATDLASQAPA